VSDNIELLIYFMLDLYSYYSKNCSNLCVLIVSYVYYNVKNSAPL